MVKITIANVEALSAPLPNCCQCLVTMRWWSDSQKVTFVVFFCKIVHRYMLYRLFWRWPVCAILSQVYVLFGAPFTGPKVDRYQVWTLTSSMVSGSLVLRVSGRERTSKPDRRQRLSVTLKTGSIAKGTTNHSGLSSLAKVTV